MNYSDKRMAAAGRSFLKAMANIDYGPTTPKRFFIDSLTLTGEPYLIPAARRADWDAFDALTEETCEALPVPSWARPIEQLSWVEFERPEEIFK